MTNKFVKIIGITIFILLFVLASRIPMDKTSPLEGEWISNKEKTLSNVNNKAKFSANDMSLIANNLGKMVHVFRGSRITTIFEDIVLDSYFRIVDIDNNNLLTIETYEYLKVGSFYFRALPVSTHKLKKTGDCISVDGGSFNEYFCKQAYDTSLQVYPQPRRFLRHYAASFA